MRPFSLRLHLMLTRRGSCRTATEENVARVILSSGLFDDVIVNGIHGSQRDAGYVGTGHSDSECFFHADYELQSIDRIKP